MTDDGTASVREALDEALMETHHLANLSGLDEARLARRRLVEAQSASSVRRTRDRLRQATEYLELARLERRDTAAGFVQARELVAHARAGLRSERPVESTGSPVDLLADEPAPAPAPAPRRSIEKLRAEAAVNSFQQLRFDVLVEQAFRGLRRELDRNGSGDGADGADLDPETAIELASIEMDIERSLQGPDVDSEFEFVDDSDLVGEDGDAGTGAGGP